MNETKETVKGCDTCIYKPKEGENYPYECGECCYFYASGWEEKR